MFTPYILIIVTILWLKSLISVNLYFPLSHQNAFNESFFGKATPLCIKVEGLSPSKKIPLQVPFISEKIRA